MYDIGIGILIGILITLLIVLIVGVIIWFNMPKPCIISRNFERQFLEKIKEDPVFLDQLDRNPKGVLEEEISNYIGKPFVLPDNINVKVIQENPNDLYLLIPSQEPLPASGPLDLLISTIGDNQTFGTFMGNFNGLWWRLGLHEGSCISDIENEIQMVKNRTCLQC